MSIWSSFCTFGYADMDGVVHDPPYLDSGPPDGQLLSDDMDPERAAKTPRGGFVDLAGTWYEASLVRLIVEETPDRPAEVYLHVDQLRRLRDRADEFLKAREEFLKGRHSPPA